jgi:hypothetical protein
MHNARQGSGLSARRLAGGLSRLRHRGNLPEGVQESSGERQAEQPAKVLDVIYIAGAGRSGSTLIERLLESYPGVCSIGEIGLLSHFVLRLDHDLSEIGCPCGKSMPDCEAWQAIRRCAGLSDDEIRELISLQHRVLRLRSFFMAFIPFFSRRLNRRRSRLAELTFQLYRGAAEASGSSIVIDGSNIAAGALLATRMPSVRLHIVHAVRLPEAVVQSWRSTKHHPGFGRDSVRRPMLAVVLDWWLHNLTVEMMRLQCRDVRYCRYETLVEAPSETVAGILSGVLGRPVEEAPAFVGPKEVHFETTHAILGNPDRYRGGLITIRNDERFRRELPSIQRWTAVLLTVPLRFLYSYRLFR